MNEFIIIARFFALTISVVTTLSYSNVCVAHQCEKLVLEVFPQSQHRPIEIMIKDAVSPQEVPFRGRYSLKKADWEGLAKSVDMSITDIVPVPDN